MIVVFNWFCYFMCLINSFLLNGKCDEGRHRSYKGDSFPMINSSILTRETAEMKGLYSQEVINYEVVVPKRVDERGAFLSNDILHHYKKRSAKESSSHWIFYKFPIAGEDCIVQLSPNPTFVSPGAVVEVHGAPTHSRGNDTNDRFARMFDNLHIKRLKSSDCHYSGVVRGVTSSKVALSTCFGLAGFIQTKNGTYTIEPVADYDGGSEDEYPHILYRNDEDGRNWAACNTIDFHGNRTTRDAKATGKDNVNGANASARSFPLYIETLIVLDKTLLSHYVGFDPENYILTVFNMAFSLFHDASLGYLVKLSLVRIIRLELEQDGMNMNANQDAVKTLENFQEWQHNINPGDDTHPNHHDIAILITRVDTYSNLSYGFLGVSTLGSACDKKQSAILCKDNGLRLGFIIAHQIAHLLGAEHDGFNNSCIGLDGDGFRTVMHPKVLLTTESWSRCTQGYLKVFLESGSGNCLYDAPSEHHFSIPDLLPGTIYNADFQCRQIMSPAARECDEGSTCDSLNCQIPGYFCVLTKVPPAAGTPCGENMWCRRKKCLMVGERPNAIDGNWGDWSPWSECSRTCGSGVSKSERLCNRPIPSFGGRYCYGKSQRHRICSSRPCDMSKPSFRDIQCGEFDDWIYPEDGRKHTWKEYFPRDGNPCILFCINENLEVVALKPRVIDGTSCYKGMRDICVEGECRSIPCDLNLESNAIEDVCGVCHGDGTTCEVTQGQSSFEKFPKAITRLITVPAGTRNIKVEEVLPSAARIVVRDKETKYFYVRGNKLGMYSVPGSQAWLGMLKSRQEALTIPGPVTKPLTIWIERVENVTVKWSMALPTTQQRKPEFTWDFVRWGPCSAMCGPGTQKSEPSCIEEKAGLVESSYCSDLEVPPAKVRFCELAKCEARWMVADWMECSMTKSSNGTSKRVRRRVVQCVRTVGEGEGEEDVLSDEECPPPKPEEEEPCDTRRKRDSSDYDAGFTSNRMKFGSHKKYDEYLKNFNAIATPQRKSETIPLHLLDTPHFKHYYRVLQTSENLPTVINLDKTLNDAKADMKTKTNSLLSQIYKNTFSGNQVSYGADGGVAVSLPAARRKKLIALLRKNCRCNGKGKRRRHALLIPLRYREDRNRRKKFRKMGRLALLDRFPAMADIDCELICRTTRPTTLERAGEYGNEGERPRKRLVVRRRAGMKSGKEKKCKEKIGGCESPAENYTIRFGQVLIDEDDDQEFDIIFEGEKDDWIGMEALRSPDGEKVWRVKGEEALQFMQNVSQVDWSNKTSASDD